MSIAKSLQREPEVRLDGRGVALREPCDLCKAHGAFTRSDPGRVFARWQKAFAAQARDDGYCEFQRHLEYLGWDLPPQALLEGTELLLSAIMAYRELDGQESQVFMNQQRYRLAGEGLPCYCLTFGLGQRAAWGGC